MAHGSRLGRKHQAIDAGFFHAIELPLHRAAQLFVADIELGRYWLAEISDLLTAIGLQLRRRSGEMRVRIDDHEILLNFSKAVRSFKTFNRCAPFKPLGTERIQMQESRWIVRIVSFMPLCYSSLLHASQVLSRPVNDLNGLNILKGLNDPKGV